MKSLIFTFLLVLAISSCTSKRDYQMVWSDEFDYTGLPDSTKWSFDTLGNAWGWGNNELQTYTKSCIENAKVENGKLVITALKEEGINQPYKSARLTTKGKGDWLYGRIEVCAKLPGGKGIWPAIWMLPSGSEYGHWPESGEIDIMEHVGYEPDSIYCTVHTEAYNHSIGTHKSKSFFKPDAEHEFNVYAIDWTPKKIDFYINHEKVFTFRNENKTSSEWPYDKNFYLVLNVAVGGDWGGKHGVDDSIFPQKMEIDYVRVYTNSRD